MRTLLSAIREIFSALPANVVTRDRITSEKLGGALAEREGEPWPEFRKGKPIIQNQIARLLEPFGVRPKTIRLGTGTAKGYLLEVFDDAFRRYLPTKAEA